MTVMLLVEWFLLIPVAILSGRALGARKGGMVSAICAFCWLLLALTTSWDPGHPKGWLALFMVAGCGLIMGIGVWSADGRTDSRSSNEDEEDESGLRGATAASVAEAIAADDKLSVKWVSQVLIDFEAWLERYGHDTDPWPEFDEFIRELIQDQCKGSGVRTFRILSEGDMLLPLRAIQTADDESISARRGVLGYVATTGKTYVAGDPAVGELLHGLASGDSEHTAWAFAVSQGPRRIGVIAVRQLALGEITDPSVRSKLETIEKLISLFWNMLNDTCRVRCLSSADSVTGLLTREAFLTAAEEVLTKCYRRDEPVALVVIAVEGLRALDDAGRWSQVNALVGEIGQLVSSKCRSQDCVGRFDDSRFVMLLRCVDSELATLIVNQLIEALRPIGAGQSDDGVGIGFRCGVGGSGLDKPDLTTLISRATARCHEARRLMVPLCSDVGSGAQSVQGAR